MRYFPKQIASPLARFVGALAAASLVVGATGCANSSEGDGPNTDSPEVVTGQAASAVVSTYYDFIANAPGGAWSTNSGGVSYGLDGSQGVCKIKSQLLEDATTRSVLVTKPKEAPNGFMHGTYTVTIPAASTNPTLTATYGYLMGGSYATFVVKVRINGNWVSLVSNQKPSNSAALTTTTVNLSGYAGQTLQFFIGADADANNFAYAKAAWTDLRIVADGATNSTACTIGGVGYAEGAVNPAVSCQVCDPNTSTTAWSIRADSCQIGGVCYDADVQDPLKCKRCDPLTSQTSWTNQASCDNLVIATTRSTKQGDWGGVTDGDAACASEGAAIGLPGKWQVMVSKTGTRDYKDAVAPAFAGMPVVNLQGEQLYSSWNSIFSDQLWPAGISMYNLGTSTTSIVGAAYTGLVWTGSAATGLWDGQGTSNGAGNCGGWTNQGYWCYSGWCRSTAWVGDFSQRKLVRGDSTSYCDLDRRLTCVLTPPAPTITVQNYDGTALGDVMGKTKRDSFAYYGIPYAAPPTGNLRFAPPAKATSWSGVRIADTMGSACPQPPLLPVGGMIGSEDCLFLNVWTPKTAIPTSALPVLVYQFGGGHIFGGTASADDWLAHGFIDGDRFAAAQNAIIVTIQTRSGPLGWLTDPALAANSTSRTSTVGGGTSGNYGLLDAIQSLKWVKRNIASFGGDPNKVTFFGESSGATIVCDILASPLAKDPADNKPYFSSIIMESGFCENPPATYRQTQATSIINSVGCGSAPDKVACLRAASLQSFVNTEGAVLSFFPDMFAQNLPPEKAYGLTFGPHVDGYVLPTHPRLMFAAGTHNKVPTIVGNNKDEATFFMLFMVGGILTGDLPNLIVLLTCNDFVNKTNYNLGTTLATSARSLYTCNGFDGLGPTKAYAEGITHLQYECPARRTARALDLGQTQNVYRYWFTHRGDNLGIFHNLLGLVRDVGASHTFELPFVFNTHNTMLGYWPSSRERALTTTMQTYWRSFANSGNPNYTGGVTWPAYDRTIDNTLKLEVAGVSGGTQVVNNPNGAKCDFWDNNFNLDGWK